MIVLGLVQVPRVEVPPNIALQPIFSAALRKRLNANR